MHNRIIILAKIALIIAAAQIHITTANFISNPANKSSNATYAMSNEEEQTIFEAFKNGIESNVQPQTNYSLSEAEQKNIEQKIQDFIKNDEEKALLLYIANLWGIINGLDWQIFEVSNYVQICLIDLYKLAQGNDTIQIENESHRDIAKAIKNLRLNSAAATNKLRIKLLNILNPYLDIDPQNQKKADTQTDREAINDLTTQEKQLIQLLNNIVPAFRILADKKPNKATTIIKLIDQICLPYNTYNPNTPLMWFINNAHKKYEPDELKGENLSSPKQLLATLHLYRPDLLLALQLLKKQGIGVLPDRFTEDQTKELNTTLNFTNQGVIINIRVRGILADTQDKQTSAPQFKKDIRITQHPVLQKIHEEIKTAEDKNNKTHSKDQYLMEEFLKFIIGWCNKESFDKYNKSTIFKDAANKIQTAEQNNISVQLTEQHKELLENLAIAYTTAAESLIGSTGWRPYARKCLYIYAEILNKVLKEGKIDAREISQELNKHKNSLKAIEEANKAAREQEGIEVSIDKSMNNLASSTAHLEQQQQQAKQPGNEKAGNIDIKQIKQLIQKWIKQKEKTNKEKEAKLKKLEQAINSLERKYKKIVKENEGKLR